MKKLLLAITPLCISMLLLVSCGNSNGVNDAAMDARQGNKIIKTENFAIYASNMTEKNETEINEYVHYERNISIIFPQIYYSNKYEEYDEQVETQINRVLFRLSIGDNEGFLIDRDNRQLKEYDVDYTITKVNEELFSIKYIAYLDSVSHAHDFCYGITVNAETGEASKISDYISIDDNLIRQIETGNIKYYTLAGYEKEFIMNVTEQFINDYKNDLVNVNSCFYMEENMLKLIVPVHQGNSSYIILEMPIDINSEKEELSWE